MDTVSSHTCTLASNDAESDFEIVIVAYRSRRQLAELLPRLPTQVPVTIIDNSADVEAIQHLVDSHPRARRIDAGGNLGFGAAVNLAVSLTDKPYVILLNPDCSPGSGVLEELVDQLRRDIGCASCAPLLVDPSGKPQRWSGGWQPSLRRALVHASGVALAGAGLSAEPWPGSTIDAGWLAGTCLAVRCENFRAVGGFDERYFLYNEDMALGRRFQEQGLKQLLRGDLSVVHMGGGSGDVTPHLLWRVRGQSMAHYLNDSLGRGRGFAVRGVLTLGVLARAVVYARRKRSQRVREMLAYGGAYLWPGRRQRGSGAFVVVVGPDGVGKTTLARALIETYPGQSAYFHFLPPRRQPMKAEPGTAPPPPLDKEPERGFRALGWLRIVRTFSRAWVGHIAVVRPSLRAGRLVVGDRWVYGYWAQPRALRFFGPSWLAGAFVRLLPRPHLVVNLLAPADVVVARKGELTRAQVLRELDAWARLPTPRVRTVDSTTDAHQIARELLSELNLVTRGGALSASPEIPRP